MLLDLDHITLKDNETLLLRARHPIDNDTAMRITQELNKRGIRAVLVAHDIDMFIGVNIAEETAPDEEHDPLAEQALIEQRYNDGYVVQWAYSNATDVFDWFDAHRFMCPHIFNTELYKYRLAPPKRSS